MRSSSFLALVLLLTGCATLTEDPTEKWGPEQFYADAKQALDEGNFTQAITTYGKLETRFPYGPYTEQAQLDIAYAHYRNKEPEAAVAAAERFIKQHPTHPSVDYAYYLRGLASFDPPENFLENFAPQDKASRDPTNARLAFNHFKELAERFPDSRYTADAVRRMGDLRNTLARYEVVVADYYMRRGAWLSAANRASYVVENYQQTPSTPDALAILAAAYKEMGMAELAADTLKVLDLNYPGRSLWKPGDKPK